MADKRKLQGEIDRCLKKIQEGLEAFDDIWKKVHGTNNTNQKEKFEADLKKEIKKLQRLRDQIKTWVVSADIKDKETLIEYRKKIESKMEQFKVIERETKTKAYSKEGLMGANGKVDPKEKEKEEVMNWLQYCITELGLQSDGIEGVIESLTSRRKKLNKEDQVKHDQCKARLQKNKFHLGKLEAILRLVDNGASILDQVNDMRDTVEEYISLWDSNSDDIQDDMYDDLYDEFDLDDIAAMQADLLASSPPEFDTDSQHSSHSSASANHNAVNESPSPLTTSSVSSALTHSKSGNKNNLMLKISSSSASTTTSTTTAAKVPPTPTKLTTPNTPSTPSSDTGSSVKPSLATTSGLGYAQVAWSHHSGVAGKLTISSPKLAHSSVSSVNGLVSAAQLVQPSNQPVSSAASISANRATMQPSPAPTQQLSTVTSTAAAAGNGSSAALVGVAQQQQQMTQSQVQQLLQQQRQQQQGDGMIVNGLPVAAAEVESNSVGGETLASLSLKTLAHSAAIAAVGAVETQQNGGDGKSNAAASTVLHPDQGLVSSSGDTKAPSLSAAATNGDQQQKLLAQQLLQQQQQQQALQQQQGQQQQGTQVVHLNPMLGVTPLGPHPLGHEHVFAQRMLETSFHHLPYPCDSERVRVYFPSNPCPTPLWYPQMTPPHLNTFEFFTRLDTDTLFFLFYYMEGTKTQYWAAKALKQKSWRFHTKYMMWFQRHEEPKTITEEFEQGTYIYFDYEKWGQRKKEGFRFEYRYLEDQELS